MDVRPDLVEHLGHDLRLHGEDQDVGLARDGDVVGSGADAVLPLHLVATLGARAAADDLRRLGDARAHEPADQGLRHVPRADEADGPLDLHGALLGRSRPGFYDEPADGPMISGCRVSDAAEPCGS